MYRDNQLPSYKSVSGRPCIACLCCNMPADSMSGLSCVTLSPALHVKLLMHIAYTVLSQQFCCITQRQQQLCSAARLWKALQWAEKVEPVHILIICLCNDMQVTGPIYKLVATNLGGEKRFAAAVARRLQSLGALTRGDRRAASGIDLSESNFDSPLGRKSLRCEVCMFCFAICVLF